MSPQTKREKDALRTPEGHSHRALRRRRTTPEEQTRNASSPAHPEGHTRDEFFTNLYKASRRIANEIDASPEEKARMEKSGRDVEEGRVRWEDGDEDGEKS
jgi:hypothetical protein